MRAMEALTVELQKRHQVSVFETKFFSKTPKGFLARLNHDFIKVLLLALEHWKLAQVIDGGHYDLVLVHPSRWTQSPFLLSFLKTPSVYYCQEPLRLVYDPIISDTQNLPLSSRIYEYCNRRWRQWIDGVNLQAAGRLLVNSHFSRNWVQSVYGRKSQVCYLGVDPKLFRPLKVAKIYDVLFFGTPVTVEGYDLLLAAMKASDHQWKVKTITRTANGQGMTDSDLVKAINQSRIVVCLAHNEPFGLTVLEAMACEVPVIAVNEGGYRESVVHSRTGLLVSREPNILAQAINNLLSDGSQRQRLGRQGRKEIMSRWTWEQSGQRLNLRLTEKSGTTPRFGDFSGFILLLGATAAASGLAVLVFRDLRRLFPLPDPGPNFLMGFATYFGYPLWFEPTLFMVLLSLPLGLAILTRWLQKRYETHH